MLNYSSSHKLFYKGWALKENQKIRTPVKRIVPEVKELLECMFHIGTANPRQKMSAKEMRDELLRCEHEGKLTWMIFQKNQLFPTGLQLFTQMKTIYGS